MEFALQLTIDLICGVVPDGTFPAPLTIGRSILHRLGVLYNPHSDNIQLTKSTDSIILTPISIKDTDSNYVSTWATKNLTADSKHINISSANELKIRSPPQTSVSQKSQIENSISFLKSKFTALFNDKQVAGSATRATGIKHDIVLDKTEGLKSAPSRYSPKDTSIIKEFITAGIKEGILYSGQSPFSSRAILVPKDNIPKGRMVIDFRQINAHTEKSAYPLPVVQDEIPKAAGHNFYVKFDLKPGFYQIELTDRAQKICSFVTPQGQYLLKVMPFGLTNAPATFQRAMDECLQPVHGITSNMIDDVITWGNTIQKTVKNASLVMERLQSRGYRLNTRKCAWFVT